jgi:hypothetical protein
MVSTPFGYDERWYTMMDESGYTLPFSIYVGAVVALVEYDQITIMQNDTTNRNAFVAWWFQDS